MSSCTRMPVPNELTHIDEREPEEIARHRERKRRDD